MARVADVAMGIVSVAMITTIVAHKNSAKVITATGGAFGHALGAAEGRPNF